MPLQATAGAATYDAFGGGVTAANYIEDVFSTYLYTGNGSTQTITNGIDLAGKGGLVWIKMRSQAYNHVLVDTARGVDKVLCSNNTNAEQTGSSGFVTQFNANGFDIGNQARVNLSSDTFVSWTFRKAPKFFDVVTYTGNGSGGGRAIPHSLGATPGMVIWKSTSGVSDWVVNHRSLGYSGSNDELVLNTTSATVSSGSPSTVDASNIYPRAGLNGNGVTYVAYLFAHDAGGFGASGTDNVISCGSFTTDGSGNATVTLGYEPQWLLIKATGNSQNWILVDVMRGMALSPPSNALFPNTSGAEYVYDPVIAYPTATGFYINGASGALFNSASYIYIAIRRGPMRTPTTGTSVYGGIQYTGTGSQQNLTGISFPPDYVHTKSQTGYGASYLADRLRGPGFRLQTENTSAEADRSIGGILSFNNDGFTVGVYSDVNPNGNGQIAWCFRRAPGFFDVVCYTGTGSAATVSHNLGVVPELMIVKRRDTTADWWVYDAATGNTKYQVLNSTATPTTSSTAWNNTTPTSSVFTVGTGTPVNASAGTYVAYLFATVAGVSKVGSYTGTGTTLQVNCGFTAGARFVLIKRTDSTGDWYVWDSARGIVAGNDPYLLLNSTAAEVTSTDYVDTYSAGFEISSTAPAAINANGGTFIFLAIA